jgi:class 3 adenylate cyclase
VAEQSDASLAREGERKTVTALFADIKGSMDLIEDIDPEEARAILDPAIRRMIDSVHHYGYIVQSTATGSSHCSVRRSRTRITHNEPCSQRSACRRR